MNFQFLILVIIAILCGFFLLWGFFKTKKKFKTIISSAFFGFLSFLLVAISGNLTGIYVGINLPSLIVSLTLGIPGVIFLAIMNFL